MKFCVIQPYYSFNAADAEQGFQEILRYLSECDRSMDVIVLPEYCDVPAASANKAAFDAMVQKYNPAIMECAKETAIRCEALVFVNCAFETENGYRNTTYAIDGQGDIIDTYFKAHPAPSEVKTAAQGGNGLDVEYSYEPAAPHILEHNGIRYGFMTCYDFYFYEAFAPLARQRVDVIIGASHQRTDTHQALGVIGRFLSYNTGAYLVRAAVTLGEDSPVCGCSMMVSPDGSMLLDMKSKSGLGCAEFDPTEKYLKPAGFRGAMRQHWEYIEEGRRPWLYRNGGAKIIRDDNNLPYPRVCAHRGFSTILPENSLPAYGAAVAMGADEIELDLYESKDGVLVSIHDNTLDRISTGQGKVWDCTLAELKALDFGMKHDEKLQGLPIATFEEILHAFAGSTIMNIHLKEQPGTDLERLAEKVWQLLHRYDCEKHAYLMCDSNEFSAIMRDRHPEINRCASAQSDFWDIVDRAIALDCRKVQFFKPYFNQGMIDKARAHGIICNVFFADDPDEAIRYLEMGMDTILTNNFLAVNLAVQNYIRAKNL